MADIRQYRQVRKEPSGTDSLETNSTAHDSQGAIGAVQPMCLEQRMKSLKFHERIAREVLIVSAVSQDYDILQNVNKKSADVDENVLKNENFGSVPRKLKNVLSY